MRKILLLLPLLAAQIVQAQWTVVQHKKLPEDQNMHLIPMGDRYVGVGADIAWVTYGSGKAAESKGFLKLLDRDLQVLKEYHHPQTLGMSLFWAEVTPQYIYVSGRKVVDGHNKSRLMCFDHDLQLRWDKTYTMPGCVDMAPLTMQLMPDGDIMGMAIGDGVQGNQYKGVNHFRLSPEGELRWAKNYMRGRWSQHAIQRPVMLKDGTLLVTGYTFRSTDPDDYKGFDLRVWKLNYETGDLIWEKTHAFPKAFPFQESEPGDPKIRQGLLLPSGDVAYAGEYETAEKYQRSRNFVVVIGGDGEVKYANAWRRADDSELEDLQACDDGLYRTLSMNRTHAIYGHADKQWTEIVTLDARMNIVREEPIEVQGMNLGFRTMLRPGVAGDYLYCTPYEIAILRKP